MKLEGQNILDNRGVALLLAVTVISLLIAVTVQFSKDMRQELMSSANLLSSSRMNIIAKSGFNIAEAVLRQDSKNNKYDTFFDIWAELGQEALNQFYSGKKLEVKITDLSGRIQLNGLTNGKIDAPDSVAYKTRDALRKLLVSGALGEVEADEADVIVDALTDWLDEDDNNSGTFEETETGYYRSLDVPYSSKNAPMDCIEELLLIRGITERIYFGSGDGDGLKDLVTVHGADGKVNINTAPEAVLKALTSRDSQEMSDEFAGKMVTFRDDQENVELLKNSNWYSTVLPQDVNLDPKLITTSSKYFRILSRTEISGMVKNMTSFVERAADGKLALLQRKVE